MLIFVMDVINFVNASTTWSKIIVHVTKIKVEKSDFTIPLVFIRLTCITDHKVGNNITFHLVYDAPLSFA